MIQITGTMPSLLANKYKEYNGDITGIVVKGDDIDIDIYDGRNTSHLDAIWLGNGTWEITNLDDSCNLFPDYDESDVISVDVLNKIFLKTITSGLILSFNPLGKIKYGVKDVVKDVKDKVNNIKGKIQKGIDWVTDALPPEVAQDYIRKQKGFSKAKVGRVEKMYGGDGGNYKVLAGNPEDKTYSVWQIYRNGNDFRTLAVDKGLTPDNAIAKFDELLGKKYDGSEQDVYEEGQFADNLKQNDESANNVSDGTEQPTDNTSDENNVSDENEETSEQNDTTSDQSAETSQQDNVIDIGDDSDPYNVLNIPKDADIDTIKKAYRQLSKKYHPDKDTGDIDRFNDVQKAYKTLTSSTNVFEGKEIKKKKSKYNGKDVTGCTESDGSVAFA